MCPFWVLSAAPCRQQAEFRLLGGLGSIPAAPTCFQAKSLVWQITAAPWFLDKQDRVTAVAAFSPSWRTP